MLELTVKYDKRDFFGHFMYTEQITRYNDLQTLIINKEFIDRYASNDKIQLRHYIRNNEYIDIVLSLKETRKYIKDFIQEATE